MFALIEAEKTNFTVTRMIALLKVSRSGYYKWVATQAAGPSPAAVRRAALDAKVAKFHHASDDVYGSPRILADLREDGETVSRKTVAASMTSTPAGDQPPQVHPGHHHRRQGKDQPGGSGRPQMGHRRTGPGVDLGHHLPADRAGLGVFVRRP